MGGPVGDAPGLAGVGAGPRRRDRGGRGFRSGAHGRRELAAAVQLASVRGWHVTVRMHARGRWRVGGRASISSRGACDGDTPGRHLT